MSPLTSLVVIVYAVTNDLQKCHLVNVDEVLLQSKYFLRTGVLWGVWLPGWSWGAVAAGRHTHTL